MNDPGQWLWGLLLVFLHWLWSIRVWILFGLILVFAEKQIKQMLTEAYADALNKTSLEYRKLLFQATKMRKSSGPRAPQEQVADVVIKWMDDHPEERDQSAPFIVMMSLNEAFPCH